MTTPSQAGPGMRRTSGAQMAYAQLRERILTLQLAPGTRLYEAELAREFNVSRTPLREALRMLLSEDLVTQQATGGMLVRPLDPADMRELYAVRGALERMLVREACERMTAEDEAELADCLAQMALLVDHPVELRRLGGRFHGRIAAASGNRRGQQLMRQIRDEVARYQVLTNEQASRRIESLSEHRAIYEAMVARDSARAEQRMGEHLSAAYQAAASAIAARPAP